MPKRNTVLFDFASIVDIQIGLVIYLQKMYKDSSITSNIIDLEKLRGYTLDQLKEDRIKTVKGSFINELLIDKEDEYKAITFSLELISRHYDEILSCAPITGMKFLIETYHISADKAIQVSVLCNNDTQSGIIKRLLPDVNIVMGDRETVDISVYSRIVLASVYDILDFDDPELKDFLILNYRSNFSQDDATRFPIKVLIVTDINTISIADAYSTEKKENK